MVARPGPNGGSSASKNGGAPWGDCPPRAVCPLLRKPRCRCYLGEEGGLSHLGDLGPFLNGLGPWGPFWAILGCYCRMEGEVRVPKAIPDVGWQLNRPTPLRLAGTGCPLHSFR